MQQKKRPEYIITAFVLIALSLIGIIVVQGYWTLNAYRQTKKRFDRDIDTALVRAIGDCKESYIDSVRVVLIKRLSSPEIQIRIDTQFYPGPKTYGYNIRFYKKDIGENIKTRTIDAGLDEADYKRYKRRVRYRDKNDLPRLLTEIAFNEPEVMARILGLLKDMDMKQGSSNIIDYLQNDMDKGNAERISKKIQQLIYNGVITLPQNYRRADSIKIARAYKRELRRMNITANFRLVLHDRDISHKAARARYSETGQHSYKYHGFVYFDHGNELTTLNVRATFNNPQYAIIKNMMLTMSMSALLILFTTACFIYILHTILRQKKLAELKDDFINNMTHELKTPLATITVAIEGLQKFNALNDAEKTQRYLETSRNELNKLNDLVTKVLNIASFENNEPDLSIEEVDIDEVINGVIASEKMKATKTVNITYANADKVSTIHADKLHFRNVLLNLVDNAVKYSHDSVDIAIAVYKQDGMLCFEVKDNGIGISHENMKNIFDKFYRVPTGNLHNVKGTGLGLSYAKSIVEAHGGTLTVNSELYRGCQFIFTLPLN
ncbi:HAMP domain-containing histidine kinase [Mucilaginibacter sp. HMF5004]|uniref:sensor histidine kinase n=1 Tax=Mucilaginibacter rivuli TaxID=2857527 RepID=UPI001C5E05E9|nr:HAMP domain-containing sensor histidine kinase [Mucilaginibacter rivuli]MBW4890532.1 HAMP domain-containing histidine kinase [Mucilaginibacter rivuli]